MSGGDTSEGTATLSAAAPAGGTIVSLSSSSPAASVPSTITVPPGASSAAFIIETSAVASDTTVTILASSGGVNLSATLVVKASDDADSGRDQPAPARLETRHDDLISGTDTTGTVTLRSPAPAAGVTWRLVSHDEALEVPATATIPAGARTVTFRIRTKAIAAARTATITATGEIPAARSAGAITLKLTLEIWLLPPVNEPPTITGPTDQVIDEDTSTGPLAFTIGDAETPPDGLTVSASSSNPGLVPDANIVFGGSGDSRTVTVTPAADWSGSSTITVAVSDGAATATDTFTVTVNQLFDDSETFPFTGGQQTFPVPVGVTSIQIEAYGAEGGDGNSEGGDGGSVTATVNVTPGESLAVFVGGQGGTPTAGFNGGASGGDGLSASDGGGGGGASDVRQGGTELADRIVVAGGGGGGGAGPGGAPMTGGTGGAGGGLVAGSGGDGTGGGGGGRGGGGGAQDQGGAGGAGSSGGDAGAPGSEGLGGTGGGTNIDEGGGGGGGYFGGGGGGEDDNAEGGGGGGGGSSFAIATATDVTHQQGVRAGDGLVIIRW